MKTWNESEKDAFSYFQWFNKDEAFERVGMNPNLSVFSVNGSGLFGTSKKNVFIEVCSSEIQKIFIKENFLKDYMLYLFANVEVKDRNSRIERYKKVWKLVQSKWQLNEFNKGPEIETEIDGKIFFSSIAGFKVENLSTALQIISSNPKRYTIIASKKDDVLSEKMITNFFEIAFNQHRSRIDEIDYFGLAIHLCSDGDVVFRWGDSAEEAEIAIVFSRDMLTFFSS
ncbi:hypothetical protein [Anaeromicropila populeti]|nr:hypothetical protein [Anaeromicropila populeti]